MAKASVAMKSQKNQDAAAKVRAATIGAGEPPVTKENYNVEIARAMSYYHTYEEDKVKRKWVQDFVGKDPVKLKAIADAGDHELEHLSILIRLKTRNQYLPEEHEELINKKLQAIFDKPVTEDDDGKTKVSQKTAMVSKKADESTRTLIGHLEGEIDTFILGGYKSDFDIAKWLIDSKVTPQQSKVIGAWFTKQLPELELALSGTDEYVNESYEFANPAKLKKWIAFIKSLIAAMVQQKVAIVRKPRKVKVKTAAELVKRLQYLEENTELNLKSVHPTKIIKAQEVWIYIPKTRKMTVYKALDSDGLNVKGSAIIGFDTSHSEVRGLRKPEDFLAVKQTKREYGLAWKALKTKVAIPNGRMTKECIILAVY